MKYNKELGIQRKLYPIFRSIEVMSDQFIRFAYMKSHKKNDCVCKEVIDTKVNMNITQLHKYLFKRLKNKYKTLNLVTSEGGSGTYGGGNFVRMDIHYIRGIQYKDKNYSWEEEKERFTVYKKPYSSVCNRDDTIDSYIEIANFIYGDGENCFGGPECDYCRCLNIHILTYNKESSIIITENNDSITQNRFWEFYDYNMKFSGYENNCLIFDNGDHEERIKIAFMSKNVDNVLKFLYLYMDKFFVKDQKVLAKGWKKWEIHEKHRKRAFMKRYKEQEKRMRHCMKCKYNKGGRV